MWVPSNNEEKVTWIPSNAEDIKLKKDVFNRIVKLRSEGYSAGKLAKAIGGNVTIDVIYNMLGSVPVEMYLWRQMDNGLRRMGY